MIKYPLRIAVNPFASSIGWVLPSLISGAVITAVVLDLPTAGPIFLQALRSEDMALAGAFVVLIGVMTVAGILISDIILAILDPRIRYEQNKWQRIRWPRPTREESCEPARWAAPPPPPSPER